MGVQAFQAFYIHARIAGPAVLPIRLIRICVDDVDGEGTGDTPV